MAEKLKKAKKRLPAVRLFFALFVMGLGMVPLLGIAIRPMLESVLIAEDPEELWSPLLLAEQEGESILLACGGKERGLLVRMSAAGAVLARREAAGSLRWAGLRGGTLYLLQADSEAGCILLGCDAETLEETSRRELDLPPRELIFFDMDDSGTVGFVLNGSRDTLGLAAADGARQQLKLRREITFLSARDGVFLTAAGNTLTILDGGETQDFFCLAPVIGAPSSELVLDEDGVVSRVEEDGLLPLFRWEQPLYSSLSFCQDGEKCLILSLLGGQVVRCDLSGAVLGSCVLETTPLAVCGTGGVTRKDGALRYTPFRFEEEPSPTPPPTLLETESSPAAAEGEFLLVPAGTTAAQLRELFRPEAVTIKDAAGQVIPQGRLATGMTANDRAVVVRGDCDGSGSVTQGDVKAALRLSLEEDEDEGAFFRAADLNDDGILDGADILLLREMIT